MALTFDVEFSPKRPEDIDLFSLDFSRRLVPGDSIAAATVTVDSTAAFPDNQLASMVIGAPVVAGTIVQQKIGGGIANNVYGARFSVTTALGYHLEIVGELSVRV